MNPTRACLLLVSVLAYAAAETVIGRLCVVNRSIDRIELP